MKMKRIVIALLALLPLAALAQGNVWAQQNAQDAVPEKFNPKYLVGAVPEVNGRVVFETTIQAPGKSRAQLFDATQQLMKDLVKSPGQLEQSRMAIEEKEKGQLVANIQEWLVFKNTPLVLDRTRLLYHLIAECSDGEVKLQMTRIIYIYDEEREPQTYKAEEWITDKWGLTKKQNKLARVSGKFRQKTIDRKDFLFQMFETQLTK